MVQALAQHSVDSTFGLAEAVFGDDFEVWAYDRRWHRIRSGIRHPRAAPVTFYVDLIDLLNSASRGTRLEMHELSEGRILCLLPLHGTDHVSPASFLSFPGDVSLPESRGRNRCKDALATRRVVAMRIIDGSSAEFRSLASRAADAAIAQQQRTIRVREQLAESDSQLAAWSARIAQGNAELSWLHQLSRSTELSGSGETPRIVAEKILPEMCRLTHACSVVFVEKPSDSADGTDRMDVWQTGAVHVPESVCLSLIDDASDQADGPPVILRFRRPAHVRHPFPGVLSCVVKTVKKDGERVGWILLVNKDLQYLVTHETFERSPTAIQRECEFGHFESGLVEAAATAISAHARNTSLLNQKERLFEGAIRSLVNAIDAKDSYTCGHSDRVAEFAREISRTMGQSQSFCERIYMTGLLHDVGKIGVPDEVLQKPGRLTEEEFDTIRKHPVIGHEILRHVGEFDYVLPGVLHHHEAVDGSGYPHGLAGDAIPFSARILAVADAWDAMTSDRPYRNGMSSQQALRILTDGAGQQWDADCVRAFQSCLPRLDP